MFAVLGKGCFVAKDVILGLRYKDKCKKVKIGNFAIIREKSIIYADVVIGNYFKTGHSVMIREYTRLGDRVVVGTNTVIDGNVTIGSFVKIETDVYIPTHTKIGNNVFIGPGVVMTNDKYPQRMRAQYKPNGPTLKDGVSVGGNATILPGVIIGRGSFIAAGSVVTNNVPAWSLAIGVPAKLKKLPKKLKELNRAKSW